ncbi:MAG: Nucleoside 5-triphosphatase RdgB (dHAPTP, dITP, XTP-specific) [Ktedonobacterales bacterium]|jgi:XTP/dITP diphosphohydrolase|nr:MAG: Nucleoside 5-triphosphatase RdgB (dHAPTP, dITP, XTP-specific) [Ktedonobacterales bacterium]
MGELQRVVLATTNPHKIQEFREILASAPCALVSPDELGMTVRMEETGATFAENAVLKALAYAETVGLPALADDSGLEIDALHGEPGVYSARWAGEGTPYTERFRILNERLSDVPDEQRTARYRCVIALAEPTPRGLYAVVAGTLEGRIAREARGTGGFGYDPIFYVPEQGRTVAEMPSEEKHAISHRGRAAAAVLGPLVRMLDQRAYSISRD